MLAISTHVTEEMLYALFDAPHALRVAPECMLLKSNMIVPGSVCSEQTTPEQVAQATLLCLRRTVSAIYFPSGGQDEIAATANLNAMNAEAERLPRVLGFSFARVVQYARA